MELHWEELKKLNSDERKELKENLHEKIKEKKDLRAVTSTREEIRNGKRMLKNFEKDAVQWGNFYKKTKNEYVSQSSPQWKQNYFQDWTLKDLEILKDSTCDSDRKKFIQYDIEHFEEMKSAENVWHYFSGKIINDGGCKTVEKK